MNDHIVTFPLSLTQQDIYFDQLHFGRSPLYNVGGYIRLGRCDVGRLGAAHARMVSTNDVFGIRVRSTDGGVRQEITSERTTALPLLDLSREHDPVTEAKSRLESLFQTPFQLEESELYRAFVIKLADDRFWYVCMAHHLIMDGWGFANLARVLGELYHDQVPEPPLALQEIVSSDQAYLRSRKYGQDREHWLAHCGEVPEKLLTPFYEERFKGSPCVPSGREAIQIDPGEYREVRAFADGLGVGVSQVLMGLLVTYFSRAYGRDRLILGVPAHNRRGHREKRMLGAFTSVSPLCVQTSEDSSFAELAQSLRDAQRKNFRHQRYPIGHLLRDLGMTGRDGSLYDVGFNYLKLNSFLNVGGEQAELVYLTHFHEATPLMLTVWEYGDDLPVELQFDYNHAYFDAAEAALLAKRILNLLRAVIASGGESPLGDLPLLSDAERNRLLHDFNDTAAKFPDSQCIHKLIEAQVARDASAPAATFQGCTLSYNELNERSNRVAHFLIEAGVGPDVVVGLCVERSLEMVVGLLGVIKAGAAYLPLEPSLPEARLRYMLENSGVQWLLTQRAQLERLGWPRRQTLALDDDATFAAYPEDDPSLDALTPEHLAYVIYTSGSTGQPKGVMIEHRALVNRIDWMQREYRLRPEDVVLQKTPFGFDVSVWEFLWPLTVGARMVLAKPEGHKDPAYLSSLIQTEGVTTLHFVPSMLRAMVSEPGWSSCRSVRHVFCSGEALPADLIGLHYRANPAPLHNLYGPTEAAIDVSYWPCPTDFGATNVPIGRPIQNIQLHVLDPRGRQVPLGTLGELHIGGVGLARGYLNRPELSAERFITCPLGGSADVRLYKTGDLARWLPDGTLSFHGRLDHQVKIRGFRIELGEIESLLLSQDGVRAAVAVARTDDNGEKRLVAYVTADSVNVDGEFVAGLRSALQRALPSYMVPSAIVVLDALPLTASGKIDRRALPEPEKRQDLQTAYSAPGSDLERRLCDIWSEILGVENIGVQDHFFEVGGNSLSAVETQRAINARLGGNIQLTDIFAYPTVADLASHISGSSEAEVPSRSVENRRKVSGDIAIVAAACRFPDARTPEAFWENICNGHESIQFYSDEELRKAGVPQSLLDQPNYVKSGFVLAGLDEFDASFFRFTPREAELLDPQQRLLLESAQEVFERAGYGRRSADNRTGVFVSVGQNRYLSDHILPNRELVEMFGEASVMIANRPDFAATRISHKFDLRGPSVSVYAACSSSLVAVHLACQSLLDGSSDMALAGASSIAMYRPTGVLADEGGIASSDGRCRSFDADADGTRPGSGAGIVLLKRLDDAIADGDPILAVIKGSAVTNDGANKVGFAAPSVDGQAAAIRQALCAAGVSSAAVGYVEAHGTGTKLGDPIEVAALRKVFPPGERPYCAIGSVKPNIGHLDSASGMASLIKVALALEHGKLPPQLHFARANPEIDLDRGPFFVNREAVDWDGGSAPRVAGVHSYGIGGTNAHIVMQQAPTRANEGAYRHEHLILLSARTQSALSLYLYRMAEFVARQPRLPLADVAYTLQVGRASHRFRTAIVARSVEELSRALAASAEATGKSDTAPEIVFLFPGQGSQYVGMGREIYRQEPVFRDVFDRCAKLLEPALGLDIRRVVFAGDDCSEALALIDEDRVAQPLLFAFEYSLAVLLRAWGVHPSQMFGQGVGAYVAACFANAIDLPEALRIVGASARKAQAVDSGCKPPVPGPEAGGNELASVDADEFSILGESPEGVARLEALGNRVLVEVGPGSTLTSLVKLRNSEAMTVTTVGGPLETESDERCLLTGLGKLWQVGVEFDHAAFFAAERRRKVVLPTHPFEPCRHWVDRPSAAVAGSSVPKEGQFYRPSWQREELVPLKPSARMDDWLIVESGCGLGASVARELEARGQRVTLVRQRGGNPPVDHSPQVVDLREERECRRLVESLHAKSFGRVVVAVPRPEPQGGLRDATTDLSHCIDQFMAVLNLARAVAATRPTEKVHFDLLTRASHSVTGLEDIDCDAATLAGLCKVIPQEFSGLSCRQLDLDYVDPEGRVATDMRRLIDELLASAVSEGEVAYRGRHRWVRSYLPVKSGDWGLRPSLVRERGVYVITGGLGKVGLTLAVFLGSRYQAKLALIGRSDFPPKSAWRRLLNSSGQSEGVVRKIRALTEIEAKGGEVMVLSADVADPDRVEGALTAVEREFGVIDGVVHCAGRADVAATAIQDMSREYLVEQFMPKVAGIRVLSQQLRSRTFDFCLSMSSLSALLGGLGFAAYAGANAFLDSFAQLKHNQGDKRWISINWDEWDVDGASAAARRYRFSMSPQEGQRAFERALREGCGAQLVVPSGPLDERLREWAQSGPSPSQAAMGKSAARPDMATEYVEPRFRIERELVDVWRRFLGVEKIGVNDDFFALGGDSLLLTRVIAEINRRWRVGVSIKTAFDRSTIGALAVSLAGLIAAGEECELDEAEFVEELI